MKKFFALFAVAAMLFACEEPVPETTLALDDANNATLNLSTDAATKVVAFTTNAAWTAAADAEWITVTPAEGVAGAAIELTIEVAENTTYDARTGKVTITAGDKTAEVVVNQVQVDEMNIGEEETLALSVGYKGGEVKFPVNHNVEFTVESDSDWAVVAEGTKALTTTEVVVNVAKNLTGVNRTATLLVAAAGIEYEVYLTQAGAIFKVNSTTVVPQTTTITPACGDADCGGVVSIALWDGKLVVCAGDGTMPKLVNKETGAVEGELVTGGFVPYYVTTDDAGNLVMCNRVRNGGKVWGGEVYFSVYYLAPGATEAVKAFNVSEPYDNPPRIMGANLGVRGNIADDATVWVPVEGYSYGQNAVNAWDIVDGVAGARQNFSVTGFGGCWIGPGYWIDAPNNFPAFAPLGTTVANGAVMMSCYSGNEINLVDGATKACTPIVPLVFDADEYAHSNTLANAIEMITVGTTSYAVVSGAGMYGTSYAYVYSVEGTTINRIAGYSLAPMNYENVDGEDVAVLGGFTSDVCLEAVEGGLNVYCYSNVGANLAAYFVAL